jgi:hypothetical protein
MDRRSALSVPAGIGLMLLLTTSAFAYVTQVPALITVSPASETLRCIRPYVVEATVLDQQGTPIPHLAVAWSFSASPSSGDQIKTVNKLTNGRGVSRVLVRLACISGDRTITATAAGVSGSAVVHVELARHGANGVRALGATDGGALAGAQALAKRQPEALQGETAMLLSATPTASTEPLSTPVVPAFLLLLAAAAIITRRIIVSRR